MPNKQAETPLTTAVNTPGGGREGVIAILEAHGAEPLLRVHCECWLWLLGE